MLKNNVIVCQKDHLPSRFTCELIKIQDGDLVLINAETNYGDGTTVWDSVHFPLVTVESYYIKEI